jgi:CheY-like chemotaxis protein
MKASRPGFHFLYHLILYRINHPVMPYILIVDDDEDDRDLFCDVVHEIEPSLHCILARNGQEALLGLRMAEFPKPQLIFLDLNMPRLNGLQCLRELKSDRSLQNIPVVIYTTSKIKEHKDECMELGAVDFLTKPTSFSELRRMVADVINREVVI